MKIDQKIEANMFQSTVLVQTLVFGAKKVDWSRHGATGKENSPPELAVSIFLWVKTLTTTSRQNRSEKEKRVTEVWLLLPLKVV